MQTKDELIGELRDMAGEDGGVEAMAWAEDLYHRIAERATREMSIRCEEMAEFIGAVADDSVRACAFCIHRADNPCQNPGYNCADSVAAYIEARVKERMEAMEKANEEQR